MKEQIIDTILKKGDEFTSGEELSKQLGISRAAVWKHINALRDQGYNIESVNRKGYRILEKPLDLLTHINIANNLGTKFIGKEVIHFETITSTNDYAKEIANEKEEGTIVIGEEQTKGRGRLGRQWKSNPGEGIWMSMILKPKIEPFKAPFLTLIGGASIVSALHKLGIDAKIKWPNDIILNNKKLSGILTELSAEIEQINYVVLGMGTNVKTMEFDEEIGNVATSLYKEGYEVSRVDIVQNILREFEELYIDYVTNESKERTLEICRKYSAVVGKDIYVLKDKNKQKVHCLDINDEGNLIIEDENGCIKEIFSGEVSIRGIDGYI